jgi:hypothetical protein
MSRIIGVILFCVAVSLIVWILYSLYNPEQQKYDITITEGNQQRVQNCDMPHGWKIITDGKGFSYETDLGYRSFFTYSSPLEVCEKANNSIGKFKRDWKYLK